MTASSATFSRFFRRFPQKFLETPSTFRVAALLQIAKTFTMKTAFRCSDAFRSADGRGFEKRSN